MAHGPRIAVDAFGTDDCPEPEVAGALAAARAGAHVILVGDEAQLRRHLDESGDEAAAKVEVHHAPDVIDMSDAPSKAIRQKPEASMPVCFDLVKRGEADAAMSAGNSGAMLACGLFKFRRIKGIDRPAIVTSLPSERDFVCVIDGGVNVDCRPINLVQFAVMGSVYAKVKHGRELPRVGVLSNGTEDSKGTDLTRAAHRLLGEATSDDFAYHGYVEGDAVLRGDVDVAVTDGFSGNIALKFTEATGRLIGTWLKRALTGSFRGKLGAAIARPALRSLREILDPDSYGAAPLLGVDHLCFICHGGSSPKAIATSITMAGRFVTEELTPSMVAAVARHKPLFDAARAYEADEPERKRAGGNE